MSDPQPGPDPALDQYEVPLEAVEFEERIQRSRFLAQLFPVSSREEALAKLEELKALSHKANHHCPALKLGHPLDGPETWSSDDGEPSGSAGLPILRAIDGSGLSDLLVVVTRAGWFVLTAASPKQPSILSPEGRSYVVIHWSFASIIH
jgi:putative IMPACT (imprinted ancient) family translation regulator